MAQPFGVCPREDGHLGCHSWGPSEEEEQPKLMGLTVSEGGGHAFDSLDCVPPKDRGA